jgi:hypothetical protein
MYKNIKVEAEHNELILENSHGDKVIIPANKRDWVKQKLSEGCHDCIDSLVETLPVASQYAQDGSVYPPGTKVKVNHNNQIKEYDISSPEYKDLYNSGKLMSYDKNKDIYITPPMKEVTVVAEAPQWLKYKREYEKNNPKSDYINNYLTPFSKSLGNTETNYPKRLDEEYEQKSLDYVSEQLIKNKPQGKLNRTEWLNQMSDKEEELIKRNPKYQSSLWADTKRGLTSLVEQNPLQTFQNILNSSDYTNREKQEMLKDYADHPVMSKLGDAAKILNPLTVPSKMVQSAYKDDYSFTDALKGKKNNAGIVEDIVTDPLNLVGVGLVGKASKADKVIDATKVGSNVLNKEERLNKLTELASLTEKEIAQKRANRLLAQKNKWVGQDNKVLEEQLKNAGKNHENNLTAQEFNIKYNSSNSPSNIGINKEGKTFIFKDAPLTELNKKRVAAHEVGHYYRNTLEEGLEWDKYFDFTGASFKEKKYLRGKGLTGNGSVKGDELRERAAQLKDFIAVKNNIPLDKDFVITPSQFDDALKNYVKETGLDNNMETFIKAIKDKKGLLKEMNKKALGIAPAALYLQSQNQNKLGQ